MNLELFISSLFSAVVGGSLVAVANHLLTTRRERSRRLADMRIQTLIDAWRKIEAASNIDDWTHRDKDATYDGLEGAIASVILLGDSREVKLAQDFCESFRPPHAADPMPLLQGLKSSLRQELGLKQSSDGYVFLRMHRDK